METRRFFYLILITTMRALRCPPHGRGALDFLLRLIFFLGVLASSREILHLRFTSGEKEKGGVQLFRYDTIYIILIRESISVCVVGFGIEM